MRLLIATYTLAVDICMIFQRCVIIRRGETELVIAIIVLLLAFSHM